MDRIARELGDIDPVKRRGTPDVTVDEMESTVAEFYRQSMPEVPLGDLSLDSDLRDIFNVSKRRKTATSAQSLLHDHRKSVIDKIAYWTGVQRPIIRKLIDVIEKRIGELRLRSDRGRETEYLTNITVYVTAMAMNYMARGKFVQS